MKIFSKPPEDWRELQTKVSQILSDIGYDCEIEKDIQTAREIINIDVFAINTSKNPQTKILCECKYWNNAVPKTIVHAFRTAVTDFGANYGLIISKAGFQSGSYEAVKNTNVILLNWNECQDYFKSNWIKSKTFHISKMTKDLYNYVSAGFLVFFKNHYNKLNETDLKAFNELNTKYFHYAFHASNLDYKDDVTNEFDIRVFDMYLKIAEKEFGKSFSSLEEYYNYLITKCNEGVVEFDNLFREKIRR
ncbi:MAG: restriction endonuclease [Saprospiraceae bacterium]|nr:restriction endonuclease [Candidatus Defluviibacterium haderslevense]MBK7243874.1 restriction endonuclease [Candidatus Defluviibacterium haderslevense]